MQARACACGCGGWEGEFLWRGVRGVYCLEGSIRVVTFGVLGGALREPGDGHKCFRGLLGQMGAAKGAAQVEDQEEGGKEWRAGQSDTAKKKEIRKKTGK